MTETLEELAEELALEEYQCLQNHRDTLLSCKGYELESFDWFNSWRDNFADWFADCRNQYLEEARQIIAQEARA